VPTIKALLDTRLPSSHLPRPPDARPGGRRKDAEDAQAITREHPVKTSHQQVEIVSMNHGFAVDPATLPANARQTTCRCSTARTAASR